MKFTVTIPTAAGDVRPDQHLEHADTTWHVDEVSLRRDNIVAIAVRPLDRDTGKRKMITTACDELIHVHPTAGQHDELTDIITTALGPAFSILSQSCPTAATENRSQAT